MIRRYAEYLNVIKIAFIKKSICAKSFEFENNVRNSYELTVLENCQQ